MKIQIVAHFRGGRLFEGLDLIRGGAYFIILFLGWALIREGASSRHYGMNIKQHHVRDAKKGF